MSTNFSNIDIKTANNAYGALGLHSTTPSTSTTPTPIASTSAPMDIPPAEDPLLHFLTSSVTKHGERAKGARIISRMLLHIHGFTRAPPLPIVRQAVLDAAPAVRTMMHKHAGKVIGKPVALSERQRTHYAVKAILKDVRHKPGSLAERLARQMIDIVEKYQTFTGGKVEPNNAALKRKKEIHEIAMVNRYVYMEISYA